MKTKIVLLLIFLIALYFRFYGLNWDQGAHFHPDERMLVMVTDRVQLFNQLNPDFFNYGSLPVYILRGVSQATDSLFHTQLSNYDGLLYVGRIISAACDLLVMVLIFRVALLLFENKKTALWSALLYAFAFFPIQNSHFFIVDTFLNLFVLLLAYLLLRYYKNPQVMYLPFISLAFAACITTKVSAVIFLPVVLFVLSLSHNNRHLTQTITGSVGRILIFGVTSLVAAYVFMPFGFIEYQRFFSDISLQVQMNSNAYIFPYTLQYVYTTPYLYYLKNIFLWGLGPVISTLSIVGGILLLKQIEYKKLLNIPYLWTLWDRKKLGLVLFSGMYLLYFIFIGRSAVKFMRYMLLMYPFFVILAGYGMQTILNWKIPNKVRVALGVGVIIVISLWTTAFVQIYSVEDTRHQATDWIINHVPVGATLAVEHWDDRLPVHDGERYQYQELQLYNRPDNELKWQYINMQLKQTDYIVIASNRLYVPLQKLSDCNKYLDCYPKTAEYYKKLFGGKLPFKKVAEFTDYPHLTIGPWTVTIPDDTADESFTVYDHPKIFIFKKA